MKELPSICEKIAIIHIYSTPLLLKDLKIL